MEDSRSPGVNQFVVAAAFAALLMGWTISVVALQVTDDTPAPVFQNVERPPSACEDFDAATAFLSRDAGNEDLPLLILTAAGEAMGVSASTEDYGTNPSAAEAARRLGQMLLACTAERQGTAP
jgi:hypothetical protein